MYILGVSSFYHDSAACLIYNGEIIAAAQEERFTRIKHDESFPVNAIKYCIKEASINPNKIENVVFYEKPFIKFERLLETYLAFAPSGFLSFSSAMPLWIKDKLFQKRNLLKSLNDEIDKKTDWKSKILFSEHHLSHASSAFFCSPFDTAAILTLDGVGEWTTTSISIGYGKNISIIKEIHFPHSLGLLYSAFTYYTGFKVNSGEYKLMGLAPYGDPKYVDTIKNNLIDIHDDGSFHLDMTFFDYCTGLTMTSKKFNKLFGGQPRKPETIITQREMDLAASIQKVTEEIIIRIAKNIVKETGENNLCLAGGVALNCVANGVLLREKIFDNIWISPASGDAGGAVGAAYAAWHMQLGKERKAKKRDKMKGSYLGPSFSKKEIKKSFDECGAIYHELSDKSIIDKTATLLSNEKAIGWMQGRMEFGPRALGGRSIIADPRSPFMQKQLNLKVKYRESFRPFAPSILNEEVSNWFDLNVESPYMLLVSEVKKDKQKLMTKEESEKFGIDKLNIPKSLIPAVTHVDYSARVQTVHKNTNPKYYNLIKRFFEITGCPVLVNTSFNVRGEPIVCTPYDAFKCFMGCELEYLIVENFFLVKEEQKSFLKKNYAQSYELD